MSGRRGKRNLKDIARKNAALLTEAEVEIIQTQIRRNSILIDGYVFAIDLLANKERCPDQTNVLFTLRKRLSIAMEENDTFRRVLWHHIQLVNRFNSQDEPAVDAVSFLLNQIKSRERLIAAQIAMK